MLFWGVGGEAGFFAPTVCYNNREQFDWIGCRECIMFRSRHSAGVAAWFSPLPEDKEEKITEVLIILHLFGLETCFA